MKTSFRLLLIPISALVLGACSDDDETGPDPLFAPTAVQVAAVAGTPTRATLSFGAVTGATGYEVQRVEGAGVTWATVGTPSTNTFEDTGLRPGTTYRYRVAAIRASGKSGWSDEVAFTTAAEGPKVATISGDITSNRTLHADTTYTLSGFVHVTSGATLTIQPGTTILGDYDVLGSSLIVLRGAKIMANGTADAPIVFTSERPVGQRRPGDWGGLVIVGNARINRASPVVLEGTGTGTNNNYSVDYSGGTDDADDSGVLRYVRVEFAGYAPAPDQELNAFTLAAVGSGTTIEYVQALSGLDDHFELFGGTVDVKYAVSYESGDDHFDMSEGYRGRMQYLIGYQSKVLVPRSGAGNVSSDPQGIENDGCAGANCTGGQDAQPLNLPLVANFTLVGTGSGVVDATSGGIGMVLRRGTAGYYVNGVVARWPKGAFSLRDNTTMARVTSGELQVKNVYVTDSGPGVFNGTNTVDLAPNAIVAGNETSASLFAILPNAPTGAIQFDWSPTAASPIRMGGMTTFTGAVAARAGTVVVGTSYVGAADPNGAKWWQGWTRYADD